VSSVGLLPSPLGEGIEAPNDVVLTAEGAGFATEPALPPSRLCRRADRGQVFAC
jgi:hypothetical protein